MLEKIRHFFSSLFNFGGTVHGVKRELEPSLSPDEILVEEEFSSFNTKKKIRLVEMADEHQISQSTMLQKFSGKFGEQVASLKKQWPSYLESSITGTPREKSQTIITSVNTGTQFLTETSNRRQKDYEDIQFLKEMSSNNLEPSPIKRDFIDLSYPLSTHQKSTEFKEKCQGRGTYLNQLEQLMSAKLADTSLNHRTTTPARDGQLEPPQRIFLSSTLENGAVPKFSRSYFSNYSRSSSRGNDDTNRGVASGGIKKSTYRPLHEKLYGSPKSQKRALISSMITNQSISWAVQNCVRMDDKLCYKKLLSQFIRKTSLSKTNSSLSATNTSTSSILVEKVNIGEALSIEHKLKQSNIVIDLENDSAISPVPIKAPKLPSSQGNQLAKRVNSLEDALAMSPQYDYQFISNIKSRYGARERERQRLLREEVLKAKIHGENREEWEKTLESRLRKQLAIVPKPVLTERDKAITVVLPDITEEMHCVINDAMRPHPENEVLCDAFNLPITRRDVASLAGLNWLNDQIINFYFTLIMERSKNSSSLPKVYSFNTFFYPKLTTGGHAALKRWTRRVDLFEQDLILIPVHLSLHWCVAIIFVKEQCIRYYDSMGGQNMQCLKSLKKYLEDESLDKRKKPLDICQWKLECVEHIPQQMNGSDCGMFACKYAEYVSRNAKITFTQQDMPYFRKRMVYEIITKRLIHP